VEPARSNWCRLLLRSLRTPDVCPRIESDFKISGSDLVVVATLGFFGIIGILSNGCRGEDIGV
jgi:hypothetical protein